MPHQLYDLDCSRTAFDMVATMVVVVKFNLSNWLLHGAVPVVERRPTKKSPIDDLKLLAQLNRRRDEAEKMIGCAVPRICVACEAGCKILAHLSKNPGHLSKISGSGPNLLVLLAENCCGGQTVVHPGDFLVKSTNL